MYCIVFDLICIAKTIFEKSIKPLYTLSKSSLTPSISGSFSVEIPEFMSYLFRILSIILNGVDIWRPLNYEQNVCQQLTESSFPASERILIEFAHIRFDHTIPQHYIFIHLLEIWVGRDTSGRNYSISFAIFDSVKRYFRSTYFLLLSNIILVHLMF